MPVSYVITQILSTFSKQVDFNSSSQICKGSDDDISIELLDFKKF